MLLKPKSSKIAIVQPVIPDYRFPLLARLCAHYGQRLEVYAGPVSDDGTTRMDPRAAAFVKVLENRSLCLNKLTWQSGFEQEILACSVLIAPGSLRIPSAIRLAIQRKRLKLPTLFWGHAHGKTGWATPLRNWLFRLPDGYIAYTQTDAEVIKRARNDGLVWIASNSCVWRKDCETQNGNPIDVLYVGRLVSSKKPMLLLDAFADAVTRHVVPEKACLVFVGTGPLRTALEDRALAHGIADRIHFKGHLSDQKELSALYAGALVAVSPGYVGLSAIQAFANGVPMIISRTERHSPEIEACDESLNTMFFTTDSVASLSATLAQGYVAKDFWLSRRTLIARHIAANYTYDQMLAAFIAAIDYFL